MLRVRLTVALLVLSLLGCGGAAVPPTATPPAPAAMAVQLSWFHSIEFAGLYAAESQNLFADQNLQVTLNQGGFDSTGAYINPVQQVLDGTSQFGVAGADVVLRARAEGAPIVAVATIYQRNPVALLSLPKTGISTPADLAGKTVGIAPPGTTVYISYRALLNEQSVDPSTITEYAEDPATSVADLLSGKIDVLHAFVTHEAVQVRAQMPDVQVMLLSDYGIDIYSNVIFTTEAQIKDHPDQVQRMVTAIAHGLQWAVDNPDSAAQYVVDTYGTMMAPPVVAEQQPGMLASVPLIRPAGRQPGMMAEDVWANTRQVLLDQQLIESSLDVTAAYDLRFVKQAYADTTTR